MLISIIILVRMLLLMYNKLSSKRSNIEYNKRLILKEYKYWKLSSSHVFK